MVSFHVNFKKWICELFPPINEQKKEKAFIAKNISNYIINSNVDAVKDDNGRRYFILDLSNKRKGDFEFFKLNL